MNGKKIRSAILLSVLTAAAALTGCGGNSNNGTGGAGTGKNASDNLTRAEFIGMLGDGFGYNDYITESDIYTDVSKTNEYYAEIQATAEWDILEKSGTFSPDEKATIDFVLSTAVKAIGTEDIALSGSVIDENDLVGFFTGNIAQIDTSNPDAPVTGEMAQQIIDYAIDYRNAMVLPQVHEVELVEGVKKAAPGIVLNADGMTGTITAGDYQTGDVVYFEGSANNIARGIRITGINGNTFTFENASLEDTFQSIRISGTYDGQIIDARSASDSTYAGMASDIYNEAKIYGLCTNDEFEFIQLANGVSLDTASDHAVFKASFDVDNSDIPESERKADWSGHGELVVGIKNIKATLDYDHEFLRPLHPTKVGAKLSFDTEISSTLSGSVSKSIPLGEVDIHIADPLFIRLKLIANIGADGTVTLNYTTQNCLNMQWKKGTGFEKSFNSTPSMKFEAEVTLTAEATFLCDLRIGVFDLSYSLVNAQITSGAVAVAKVDADFLSDDPVCIDLLLYVPLRWGVNQQGCLLTDIIKSAKFEQTIWDSTNSPVQLHWHFEDGVRTEGDVCTRGSGQEVVQENTTPEGEPLPDYNEFEFELIEFSFIELDSYTMFLAENSDMKIAIVNMPEGYSENDLKYETEDSSICTVSNGVVAGRTPGSTIVKISTPDGLFSASLAVVVNEDYSIEGFERLQDM